MPARLVGINHVALEVDGIDEALAWYGRFFEFELRGRIGRSMAFVDMGDQFLAFAHDRPACRTRSGISGSSSTTRTQCALRSPRRASR